MLHIYHKNVKQNISEDVLLVTFFVIIQQLHMPIKKHNKTDIRF